MHEGIELILLMKLVSGRLHRTYEKRMKMYTAGVGEKYAAFLAVQLAIFYRRIAG